MIDSMLSNPKSTSSIEEHEPFDPRLWEKAKDAAREEEDLIEEIATLRRKMPGIAVENAKGAWKEGLEDDEQTLQGAVERIRQRDAGDGIQEGGGMGVQRLDRIHDVESAWRRGITGLEGLKGNLSECVAKAERALRVEDYVLEKEKR